MSSKESQPMPEGINRSNRPKAPAAPPKPNKLTIEQAFEMVKSKDED